MEFCTFVQERPVHKEQTTGHTRGMNTTAPTLIRPGLMWRLYIAAWTTYGIFISFADRRNHERHATWGSGDL